MTVVHGIEIDDFEYKPNDIREAIRTRDPLDDRLHVIAVVSNPCLYARRYILMREFMARFERDEPDAILYVVEMAYGKQKFLMTEAGHPRHLQIRTETALWHKENMVNLGVQRLLPASWRAMAWIDADLEFESNTWAQDALRILNGECDIVQLFSHCLDMDAQENAMQIFQSGGFMYSKRRPYVNVGGKPHRYWHPGYAWACSRAAYERMGGLYCYGILGSGDNIMMFSLLQNGLKAVHVDSTEGYKHSILQFQSYAHTLKFGYVPGVVRHYFHGSKVNRKYTERWAILKEFDYDPYQHITMDQRGVMVPTAAFPEGLKHAIMQYFAERNEDEGVLPTGRYPDAESVSESGRLFARPADDFQFLGGAVPQPCGSVTSISTTTTTAGARSGRRIVRMGATPPLPSPSVSPSLEEQEAEAAAAWAPAVQKTRNAEVRVPELHAPKPTRRISRLMNPVTNWVESVFSRMGPRNDGP